MDPFWKDLIDALAKVMGAIGVLVAAWALRNNARTRREDLRWRVANSAHDLLDEIHRHEFAVEAVTMLDSHLAGHSYDAKNVEKIRRVAKEETSALTRFRSKLSMPDLIRSVGSTPTMSVLSRRSRSFPRMRLSGVVHSA